MPLSHADRARKFWCASFFYRRAHYRDRSIAVRALEQLSITASGLTLHRTMTLLEQINHDTGRNTESPRAS